MRINKDVSTLPGKEPSLKMSKRPLRLLREGNDEYLPVGAVEVTVLKTISTLPFKGFLIFRFTPGALLNSARIFSKLLLAT